MVASVFLNIMVVSENWLGVRCLKSSVLEEVGITHHNRVGYGTSSPDIYNSVVGMAYSYIIYSFAFIIIFLFYWWISKIYLFIFSFHGNFTVMMDLLFIFLHVLPQFIPFKAFCTSSSPPYFCHSTVWWSNLT